MYYIHWGTKLILKGYMPEMRNQHLTDGLRACPQSGQDAAYGGSGCVFARSVVSLAPTQKLRHISSRPIGGWKRRKPGTLSDIKSELS